MSSTGKNTNYSKSGMENLAREIETIKTNYTNIINELSSEINNLHNYWNDDSTGGQVYQTFKSTFESIKPSLEEGRKYIQKFETEVSDQVDAYKQAENKILGSF